MRVLHTSVTIGPRVYRIFAWFTEGCGSEVERSVITSVNSNPVQVSVIVPAYNAARTIEATLASAMSQSVAEIELIVIDDGSTDETPPILARIASHEPRLRTVSRSNAGVSSARNAGISLARANTIAFLDADDIWRPDHLSTHLAILQSDPVLDVSFSAARFIDEKGFVVGAARAAVEVLDAATLLASNPTTTTSTWVVRRSAFARIGAFDADLARCEDQAWLVRAALAGLGVRGANVTSVDYRLSTRGLASDLAAMRDGFLVMLERLAVDHRDFVDKHRSTALASEDLYLARRALQLALPTGVAHHYLTQAFREAPMHLLAMPRSTLGVIYRLLTRPFQPVSP